MTPTEGEPLIKGINDPIMKRKDSLFRTLAKHSDRATREVKIRSSDATEFTHSKSAAVEQLDDGQISSNARNFNLSQSLDLWSCLLKETVEHLDEITRRHHHR